MSLRISYILTNNFDFFQKEYHKVFFFRSCLHHFAPKKQFTSFAYLFLFVYSVCWIFMYGYKKMENAKSIRYLYEQRLCC